MPTDAGMIDTVVSAWGRITTLVATTPAQFEGRDKETKVLRLLRREIQRDAPNWELIGPDSQARFDAWHIDVVCTSDPHRIAIEGKYKTIRDGAVPDNRKEAFFDLFKLEQYVDSRQYTAGLFLWLTDQPLYVREAKGDSADFSTHQGRVYNPETPLRMLRSRRPMPTPLVLNRRYVFDWATVGGAEWYSLAMSTR